MLFDFKIIKHIHERYEYYIYQKKFKMLIFTRKMLKIHVLAPPCNFDL